MSRPEIATAPASIGDWLLTFDDDRQPTGGRTDAPWQCVSRQNGARLWIQESHEAWAGSPWREIEPDREGRARASTRPGERLWLEGEIFGAADQAWRLARGLDEDPNADPWGRFLLIHRHEDGTFTLTTDRFGTLHAYIAGPEHRRIVGSSARAVAAASDSAIGTASAGSSGLDWLALAGFFQFGFFPADRTFYPGVRLLRPGHRLRLGRGGQELGRERWWHWRHTPDPELSFDQAVDELDRRLRLVMADLVKDGKGLALPISGGLDSRSTVAALPDGVSPWSYSYGWPSLGPGGRRLAIDSSPEIPIARRIARARGLPFESFAIEPYLFDDLDTILATSEGFQDPTQTRQIGIRRILASHANKVIAAHWGDVWLDDMGLADADPGLDRSAVLDHALGRMTKRAHHLMEHLVTPNLRSNQVRPLQRLMARELEAFDAIEEPDFRLKAFKTEQWSWRLTVSGLRAFAAAAFPRTPFYDHRLTELFERLPAEYLVGRRLQVEFLKRHAPDLARVPWQVYGADLYRYRHFHTFMLPERALRKFWRIASRRRVIERNWEVQLAGAGRQQLRDHLLRPGLRLHDLMSRRSIADLLETFEAESNASHGYQVCQLLGFAAWLERA